MRLGLLLPETAPLPAAAAADAAGLFAVAAVTASAEADLVVAAQAAAITTNVRIVVRVLLGPENPVTLAEEIAVLDNVSAGRVVVLVDTGGGTEDLELFRDYLAGRTVRGLTVTPAPAQVEVPVWLAGPHAASTGLPVLARSPEPVNGDRPARVRPGVGALTADLAEDRRRIALWVAAGVSHLLVALPQGGSTDLVGAHVARYLQPEASVTGFPRVIVEAAPPAPWPREVQQ